jgi:hypothetical protein
MSVPVLPTGTPSAIRIIGVRTVVRTALATDVDQLARLAACAIEWGAARWW